MRNNLTLTIFSTLMLLAFTGNSQNIITIAGNGTGGFSGDGSMATAAAINSPYGIAIDGAGNVFVADGNNQRIRKINASGIITTVAGNGMAGFSGDGGQATAAHLNYPSGVAVDGSGNLYIADASNQRIRKVNTSGIITTYAGRGVMGFSGDGGAAIDAEINFPRGIAVDATGNVYFADQVNNRIRQVNTSGYIYTVAGNGVAGYSGDGSLATAAELSAPAGIAVDHSGNLYIADESNQVVRKVNTSGIITTIAGNGTNGFSGDGSNATDAQLYFPKNVSLDGIGNIFIADEQNQRVRKVSPEGIIYTVAGNGTGGYSGDGAAASAAELDEPWWVVSDIKGNVYVADNYNNRIRLIGAYNYAPHFTNGENQTITVCENSGIMSIDTMLAMVDSNIGQTETWSLIAAPAYGTVAASLVATSTGAIIYPSSMTYIPATGFTGTDSFQVQVSDGVLSDVVTIVVTVTPLPVAGTITVDPNLCIGATTALSTSVTGGVWTIANSTATISAGSITGLSAGNDTIVYTVVTGCGSAVSTQTVSVNATVTPSITVSASANNICNGSSVIFSSSIAYGGSTPVYQWMKNGISTGVTASSYSSSSLANGDIITCVLTSSEACASSSTVNSDAITMAVNPMVTPIVTIAASADTICTSSTVNFTTSTINGGSAPSFTWYVSGVLSGTGNSYSYSPSNGDVVKCVLASSDACITSDSVPSNNITMAVYNESPLEVSISSSNDSALYSGESITFNSGVVLSPGVSLQWYINNSAVTGANGVTFTANIYNNDTVYCKAIKETPCHGTITSVSNAISIFATYLGVNNTAIQPLSVQLYPNPNNGSFVFAGKFNSLNDDQVNVLIYNMLGNIVYHNTLVPVNGSISEAIQMNNLEFGNYILKYNNGSENGSINFVVNR